MSVLVAIDFETGDRLADSACQVGLVRVEGGRVVYREAVKIRPPREEIIWTAVHGLTWDHLKDAEPFAVVWPKLAPILAGATELCAHNAQFDRGVMEACCRAANLPIPTIPWVCTLELAKRRWRYPTSNKLPDVCRRMGVTVGTHHEAGDDAEMCARLLLAFRGIAVEEKVISVPEPVPAPAPEPPPPIPPPVLESPAVVGELESVLASVVAAHDSEAVGRLASDVRGYSMTHGQAAALVMATSLLASIEVFDEYERRLFPLSTHKGGAILGERIPPADVAVWWLGVEVTKTRIKPLMGLAATGASIPEEATHFAEPGASGWWKIPKRVAVEEAA